MVHRLKPEAHLLYAGHAGKLPKLVLRAQYTVVCITTRRYVFFFNRQKIWPVFWEGQIQVSNATKVRKKGASRKSGFVIGIRVAGSNPETRESLDCFTLRVCDNVQV
ncbi:MAG: hypothetical protein LBP56_08205 [Odoribacteraceae bacterium]|nr:hypothetical protein [Odoribacteraceae bacterium]